MPTVLDEDATLEEAISGRSIARVGEGEYRLAVGAPCISQIADDALKLEMRAALALPIAHPCLPCIPRIWAGMPKEREFWRRFTVPPYTSMLRRKLYGSAFISRPDVSKIDRPEYWARIRELWRAKDVTLVLGSDRSLRESLLTDAKSVRLVWGPRRDAYAAIDSIEEEIGKPAGPVLLCLGATATVLAVRLAAKGVHALDLGHLGYFLKHEGIFSMRRTDTISDEYLAQQVEMHARPEGYGGSSARHAQTVIDFCNQVDAQIVLDYGCGQGRLKQAMHKLGDAHTVNEYDPAIDGKDHFPKPADVVVCTDVLEHVEPEKLGATLAHIWRLARKGAFLVIAQRPANKTLPDGRNAHLILEETGWWLKLLVRSGWEKPPTIHEKPGHHVAFWLEK